MRQKTARHQDAADRTINDIRRQTRRKHSAEDKMRNVMSGVKSEDSNSARFVVHCPASGARIAEREEGIAQIE